MTKKQITDALLGLRISRLFIGCSANEWIDMTISSLAFHGDRVDLMADEHGASGYQNFKIANIGKLLAGQPLPGVKLA